MSSANEDGLPDVVCARGLSICQVDDCRKPLVARGRCRSHYRRWWHTTRDRDRQPAVWLKTKSNEERFWAKVDRRGHRDCWLWNGATGQAGHGHFKVSPERGLVAAHAYALELATGRRRPPGMEACHHCDNPPCCNPAHIYYGTRQQNVADMVRRQRNRRGVGSPSAKLDNSDVLAIRRRRLAGERAADIAGDFGVAVTTVAAIGRGDAWAHVGGPLSSGRVDRRETRMGSRKPIGPQGVKAGVCPAFGHPLAACRSADPELFFAPEDERGDVKKLRERRAKEVCAGCPLAEDCARWALETRQDYGIFGGLTEEERRALLRGKPRRSGRAA